MVGVKKIFIVSASTKRSFGLLTYIAGQLYNWNVVKAIRSQRGDAEALFIRDLLLIRTSELRAALICNRRQTQAYEIHRLEMRNSAVEVADVNLY